MSYQDIINKKKREWASPNLMDGADIDRSAKIPFSSPLFSSPYYS